MLSPGNQKPHDLSHKNTDLHTENVSHVDLATNITVVCECKPPT